MTSTRELVTIAGKARRSFAGRLGARALVVVAMATATGATAGVLPAVIGRTVAVVTGGDGAAPSGGLGAAVAAFVPQGSAWAAMAAALVATIVTVGLGVWSSKMGTALSGELTAALRIELVAAVLAASPRAVEEAAVSAHELPASSRRPPGAAPASGGASRDAAVRLAVSREAALVGDFAVAVITSLPQSLTTLAVLAVELVASDAWIVVVGGAALFVISRLAADRASRRAARARAELSKADAEVFGQVQETVSAAEDLRLWGARAQAVAAFAEAARGAAAARSRFAAALAVSGQIRSVFTAMAPLLIVLALELSGRSHGPGEVAKLLLLVPLLMTRLEALDAMRQGLIEREPVLRATAALLSLPPHPPRPPAPEPLDAREVRGRIRFEDVSYTPPGAKAPVLDGVAFDVPEGAIVGICGPSGSGKSMLLRLLLRLDDPDEGRISLDGRDLCAIDPDDLPRLFGVVRQTSQLLQRPLRDNFSIGLEPPPDEDELRAAARAVHLDELASDGGGRSLDTHYRHQPPNLSGGECRRVLLARMLLGDARVCVLDEPEAGLPGATAEAILRTVVEQARGRTHLVVTHAPHLLASDFNLVLDRGRLVARGTHRELSESCALYRQLLAEALRD